mmetsp:Transcript_27452/g.39311  ORF Transcript_27452/g.39311 Transcript_27452/m.39311 type:complete len:380 (-) Transcript_27452:246-1385(-)|eukprot:CAMPEP_0201693794 /NCGR_PEP_ID=MMETSP0578-20130828/6260_1 /ASSEMBLY_ACC=CAM_ASM_000663 /TAXON_ID=267565 /ORGANISM="Skeletonema grethea, Strain CCMP 1804" /LENGTH=379 /DNA_ID=CAMNT_0048179375 /DNA_START=67 /DNA_END=1206 /DNA_ORIENTATION=+
MFNRSSANTTHAQGTRRTRGALRDVSNQRNDDNGVKNGKPNVNKRGNSSNSSSILPSRSGDNVGTVQQRDDVSTTSNNNNSIPLVSQGSILSSSSFMPADNSALSGYQYSGPADDIDERDTDDPLCVTSYVQDMYEHFRTKESSTSVRPVYMEDQQYINERMRSILVDWLVEVHLKFKLVPETLYLTVNIIDRYLATTEVTRPKLQLVGVTALLIASKYEEIYPPELRDLVYICDRAYSKNEILEMEEVVLKKLQYQITIPSAHAFLVRYLKAAHADKKIVQLSCYILDGTLQSYNMLHYLPSQLAAASIYIARRAVGRNSWSPTLLKYAQYCEEDIKPVARAVLAEKSSASTELRAVNKKYTSSRYGGVANLPLPTDF